MHLHWCLITRGTGTSSPSSNSAMVAQVGILRPLRFLMYQHRRALVPRNAEIGAVRPPFIEGDKRHGAAHL